MERRSWPPYENEELEIGRSLMKTFKELQVEDILIEGLKKSNIVEPTTVQDETIELILENKDVIAEAVTGSGKTLAYLLPAFQRIDTDSKDLHTLILAPTHELVLQVNNVIKELAKNSDKPVRSATVIGEVNIKRQVEALKAKPHIVVGTPGRVLELIKMKKLKAHQVKTLVIDEGDKLLSDNNIDTVKAVIKTTLRDRQLCIFSASISEESIDHAFDMMKEPVLIQLSGEKVNADITHYCLLSEQRDKVTTLRKIIHAVKPKKAIVFINRNELIQDVTAKLCHHKIDAVGMFGNARKADRKKSLDAFRSGKANVLVASDLAARGLDLQDITHVINLDIPVNLNEYVHRAGRTGRAGQKGIAISIITEQEIKSLMKLERMHGIEFDVKEVRQGELVEPVQ
jgi:superfamily II DNA/RNA helicase